MTPASEYQHFLIAHQLKRRLRIIVPSMHKDPERAYILEMLLLKREGVEAVKTVPAIGSMTIWFDPQQLPTANLCHLLETVIRNIGLKPRQTLRALKRPRSSAKHPLKDIVIDIGGMSCASCALYLEMVLQREPEITQASVNYVSETARIKGCVPKETLFELIAANGYQAFSIDSLTERKLLFEQERTHLISAKRHLVTLGVFSVPVMLLGWVRPQRRWLLLVQAILATPVILWGGRDIFRKALQQARQGSANMDSLVAMGVTAAYAYSLPALFRPGQHVYFSAATSIIDFVLLGRYLEELAKNKVVHEIRELVQLQPQSATVVHDDTATRVRTDAIRVGDVLLIRPGERIPADGTVLEGLSSVDESSVTGARTPCIKEPGHTVFDGCINGSGALHIRVTATGRDTVLSGLVHMVDQAQTAKLPIQKTADALAAVFVPAVIALSGITLAGWLIAGERFAHALANSIAVLLIACPCALGLATPAASLVGSGQAARRGIYIRNGRVLENAARIDTVIFDKTGTLTAGQTVVSDCLNISALTDTRIIQLAASAEFNSEHFLAQAIVRYAEGQGITRLKASHFHSVPDQGIRARVDNHSIRIGNRDWLEQQRIDLTPLQATAKRLTQQGKTLVYLAVDKEAAALFAITDQIRSNARRSIEQLQQQNIQVWLVTGDTDAAARPVAEQLGIDPLISAANPAKKLAVVRDLQQQGHRVAMVGDGINDAPALAAATVSLVIDQGSDIAIQTADLVLMDGDIAKVTGALDMSHKTLAIIRQNLFWAFAYNALAIPFAVAGKLSPTVASAAMALSSVSVIVNSLRLHEKPEGSRSATRTSSL